MSGFVQKITNYGLGFVLVANLVDVFFTVKYIFSGVLQEANPFMEHLVEITVFLASISAILLVSG